VADSKNEQASVMDMHPVASTNIEAIGYDAATSRMRVRFRGGVTYEYPGVVLEDYESLYSAQSKGGHLAGMKKKYVGKKVEGQ
jgi:KTSC domain